MKELSQNGRNDLAYIVRRRGYKLIRELLADSRETESTDINGNADNCIAENHDAIDDGRKDIITGQDQEMNDVEFSSLSEVTNLESNSGTLVSAPVPNHDDSVQVPVEFSLDSFSQEKSSYGLEGESEQVDNLEGKGHVSTVPMIENQSNISKIGPALNSDHHSYTPVEMSTNSSLGIPEDLSLQITVPVKENNSGSSNIGWDLNSDGRPSVPPESGTNWSSDRKALHRGQDGKVDNMAEEVSLTTRVSVMEEEDHSSSDLELTQNSVDDSYAPVESPENLSLEEKVTKFMQKGDLDTPEDNIYGLLNESDDEEIKRGNTYGNAEEVQLGTPSSEHSKDVLDGSEATSKNTLSSTVVDPPLRDASSSAECISSLADKDLDVKTSEREDQHDISHLKIMLHQKELELSRLKEQIEKEQHALSVLQANAETAISEAQKLISEKDAELLAAEESLSGLVEVEIQYRGDGEIVEVTGSFNGWHHQIKLDPQPSSSIIDQVGSRKSRLWSTMLWLYPGVYEIKFLVDGHWKIDPQRESVTRGTICNNILRVDA